MSTEQLAIEFGAQHRARALWQAIARHCRDIAEHVTIKELAYRCDVSPSLLSAALAERERNYLRAEWIPVFLIAANDLQRAALLSALAGTVGYQVSKARVLTPAERLAALEERVRRELGAVGERLIAEVDR